MSSISGLSKLNKSILMDFNPLFETIDVDIDCYNSPVSKYDLLSVGIISATKRLSGCDEMDIGFGISEWVYDLLYYNNHWDAEKKNVEKLERLIYILMSSIEDYLLSMFGLLNLPMDVYYAYPVRVGVYVLIPEEEHNEVIPHLLGSVLRPR